MEKQFESISLEKSARKSLLDKEVFNIFNKSVPIIHRT